jgi:hypothetical protein
MDRPANHLARRALVLATTALVASCAYTTVAYAGPPSKSTVIAAAKAAIRKQSSAHVVSTATSSSTKEKAVVDAGTSSGQETLTNGSATLSIKVTPTDAYVSGSSSGLTTILGLSSTDAKKLGADWASWKSGTTQYSDLKSDVVVSSLTSVLPKAKGTKLTTRTTDGTELYVLTWTTAATSSEPKLSNTLTVSSQAELPVTLTSSASGGSTVTTTFSAWDGHVVVSAPPADSTMSGSKITG